MLWAVAVVGFFGFFRLGELTAKSESTTDDGLLFSDVSVDSQESPKTVAIRLRRSKTDQGVHIYLGSTGDDLCPVAALLAYIAVRGGSPGRSSVTRTGGRLRGPKLSPRPVMPWSHSD